MREKCGEFYSLNSSDAPATRISGGGGGGGGGGGVSDGVGGTIGLSIVEEDLHPPLESSISPCSSSSTHPDRNSAPLAPSPPHLSHPPHAPHPPLLHDASAKTVPGNEAQRVVTSAGTVLGREAEINVPTNDSLGKKSVRKTMTMQ